MRYNQQEKYEIIRLVENSELGVRRTLRELGIHPGTFYNWYNRYLEDGFDGLAPRQTTRRGFWNRIPDEQRQEVVEVALDQPEKSPREVACHITDEKGWFISESSVYRILKAKGLITSPAFILMQASSEYKDKTTRINQLWQTDFTYLKVVGWGWYYLSTVLDDYSRFILAWDLGPSMKANDAEKTINKALAFSGLAKEDAPKLLSDNGPSYISDDFGKFLNGAGIKHIRGRPNHPQTQGKIERYHRSMKNVIKLENHYFPDQLAAKIKEFVDHYNYSRYHESLDNLAPADVYYGRADQILKKRKETKRKTMKIRRSLYQKSRFDEYVCRT